MNDVAVLATSSIKTTMTKTCLPEAKELVIKCDYKSQAEHEALTKNNVGLIINNFSGTGQSRQR